MTELKRPKSDTGPQRVAAILASSDLSEMEILDVARKLVRASPYARQIAQYLKAEVARTAESTRADDFEPVERMSAAVMSLKRQAAHLTNRQLAQILEPIARATSWRASLKSGRDRFLVSFLRATGEQGFREAMRRLVTTDKPDPFLEGIAKRIARR